MSHHGDKDRAVRQVGCFVTDGSGGGDGPGDGAVCTHGHAVYSGAVAVAEAAYRAIAGRGDGGVIPVVLAACGVLQHSSTAVAVTVAVIQSDHHGDGGGGEWIRLRIGCVG